MGHQSSQSLRRLVARVAAHKVLFISDLENKWTRREPQKESGQKHKRGLFPSTHFWLEPQCQYLDMLYLDVSFSISLSRAETSHISSHPPSFPSFPACPRPWRDRTGRALAHPKSVSVTQGTRSGESGWNLLVTKPFLSSCTSLHPLCLISFRGPTQPTASVRMPQFSGTSLVRGALGCKGYCPA